MTDRKLAAIIPEFTISDVCVVYMIFRDALGLSNAEFEQRSPEEFFRFLKMRRIVEDKAKASVKAVAGGNHG